MKYIRKHIQYNNQKLIEIDENINYNINLNVDEDICTYKYVLIIKENFIKYLKEFIDENMIEKIISLYLLNNTKNEILYMNKPFELLKYLETYNIKITNHLFYYNYIVLNKLVNDIISKYLQEKKTLSTIPIVDIKKIDENYYSIYVIKSTSIYSDVLKFFKISTILLKNLIIKFYKINKTFNKQLFSVLLYSNLIKYYTLNLQNLSSTNIEIKNIIKKNFNNYIELFGNPFNSSELFGSPFYEQEKLFGCIGNFFNLIPYSGVYYLNPPSDINIINKTYLHINNIFNVSKNILFILLINKYYFNKYFKNKNKNYNISFIKLNKLFFENYSRNFNEINSFSVNQDFYIILLYNDDYFIKNKIKINNFIKLINNLKNNDK